MLSLSLMEVIMNPSELPEEIVKKTRDKYIEAYEKLVEEPFLWKFKGFSSILTSTILLVKLALQQFLTHRLFLGLTIDYDEN